MKKVFFSAAVIGLISVSCTSNDSTLQQETSVAENTSSPTPSASSNDPSQKDVIQVALESKDHTTLVAAIKAAELVEPLQKSGPFTVFAPTNAAFDKLPKGTVEDLLKPEKKEALADVLQYHVSVGIYKEDMMQDGQNLGQVNSQNVTIVKKDGKIKLNGTANIIGSVSTSNGIIYVIDEVLLPPKK